MFSDQMHLDFAKNQAALLLKKINKKINNKASKVTTNGKTIFVAIRKEDTIKLNGLKIPSKIGHLNVVGKII